MSEVDLKERQGIASRNMIKKEPGTNLWYHIENNLWMKLKPHNKLPWHGAEMQVTLSRILKY